MSATRESLRDAVHAASEAVQRCRDAPAGEAKKTFGQGMLHVIRARNARIGELSASEAAGSGELQRLNAILSLMASIEFPLGGFHRERLEQVARALHALQQDASA